MGIGAPRIEGFGRFPGFLQIASGSLQIAFLHGAVRRIEVRHLVVGIHAHGRFEYFVERVRARFAGLRGEVEFVQAQFLRLREQDAFDLLRIAERADRVGNPVVRMAQGRVAVFQQEVVFFGVGAFDLRLLGIGVEGAVDQVEYLFAVGEVRLFDVAAESRPVLRFVVGGDDAFIEAVELPDMLFQSRCTPDGEIAVVRPGAFR